jgi:hypothetical protein
MRILFIIQMIVAVVMGFMGMLVLARPYALLDVVLTPDQLNNRAKMEETLALMQKATGYDWGCWLVMGVIVGGLAIIGLFLSKTPSRQDATRIAYEPR